MNKITDDNVAVGEAEGRTLFLPDLSLNQVKYLYTRLTGRPSLGEDPCRMKAQIREITIARGTLDYKTRGYVWCVSDGEKYGKNVPLVTCREKQRDGRCKVVRCDELLPGRTKQKGRTRMAKEKSTEATENQTPKAPTKVELLRTAFDDQPEWTKEDLMARTGYDVGNLNTAIGLLRRADRTKDPLNIRFDREKRVYRVSTDE